MTDSWPLISTMKPFLQEVWKKSGFEKPTTVQLNATPIVLEGKDIIAESPTGTGKTLAYLLPLLQRIDSEKKALQVVILAPSRELGMQIFEEIQKWSEGSDITGASLIGGANVKRQLEKLKKHPQIIVGTPGRLLELIKLKKVKMHEVKTIVLDEGDQLLVPEHMDTIQNVIKTTLNDRQLLYFSATSSPSSEQKTNELMSEPERVIVKKTDMATSNVEHLYFVCDQREKIDVLEKLVKMAPLKALAFANNIGDISVLASKLEYKGISLGVLHGESKKSEREAAIKNFRAGKYPLLIATDVAARGLDIEGLTHVIHFDFPENATQYLHRSGRTGRVGAAGTVISIIAEREESDLKKIGRELGIAIHKKVLYMGHIMDEEEKESVSSKPKKSPHQNKKAKKR